MKNDWIGVGIMSGTSLDGVDLALCRFVQRDDSWDYKILKAETKSYDYDLRNKLCDATQLSAIEYVKLNNELAFFFADCVNDFLSEEDKPDFIASHGHTVFHQPQIGLTTQIGNGAVIAANTKIPVVCDFRSMDVALGGQGAPLVPIGDELLFGNYDACLNLGGFSNISYREKGKRIAFDISPCNMALNYLANKIGIEYDKNGEIAKSGEINRDLLQKLNNLPYYHQFPPKSLGKEWFDDNFKPLIDDASQTESVQNLLRTIVEHIAMQVATNVNETQKTLFITGGGAHNVFLIQRIKDLCAPVDVIIPDDKVVNYKEALIFAFLGLLRLQNSCNTLSSVTGAESDSCGGCMYI